MENKKMEGTAMSGELREHELITLKTIAETINKCNDLNQMLNSVLAKVLELTGLKAGWIFLVDEFPDFTCAADHHLPAALSWDDKRPMRRGSCWCLDRFWDERLKFAVNILNCKRIEDAVEYRWGDTEGISHHATIPLWAGEKMFGILNVASPGKLHFTDEELALLQSVAYQIGTAVERTKLYQAEQKRAVSFSRLGEVTRQLGRVLESDRIAPETVRLAGTAFEWPTLAVLLQEGTKLSLRALYSDGQVTTQWKAYTIAGAGPAGTAFAEGRTVVAGRSAGARRPRTEKARKPDDAFTNAGSAMAVPLMLRGKAVGAICAASRRRNAFDDADVEVLEALADHVSLALENARLYEQRRDLARWEERNRLARDLHDSVSQMLFSLTLTARGAEGLLPEPAGRARDALKHIQELSQSALQEMRALILQLRPAGLEDGLIASLSRYGKSLGLNVQARVDGVKELGRPVEETLWRIGQEALNNVRKHAQTDQAVVELSFTVSEVILKVSDRGKGISKAESGGAISLGMSTMRERAEALGGVFSVKSVRGKGTVVKAVLPLEPGQRDEGRESE